MCQSLPSPRLCKPFMLSGGVGVVAKAKVSNIGVAFWRGL